MSTDCCLNAFIPVARFKKSFSTLSDFYLCVCVCMGDSRDKVLSMITESFSKPVQPLSCEDVEMKVSNDCQSPVSVSIYLHSFNLSYVTRQHLWVI